MKWCEHCRDHYDSDHYDDGRNHRIGVEYGPYGALLADADTLRQARQLAERIKGLAPPVPKSVWWNTIKELLALLAPPVPDTGAEP